MVCLRCYGNKACWKGREPDQHKKTAQLSGFFVACLNRIYVDSFQISLNCRPDKRERHPAWQILSGFNR
ncbi:hypothetical protein SARI_00343 [Salmonella enterica subsp. arizonae serovar 62:z4,z23:-]|uniref:Uncharacterized protein n=2 Tax=Salmonella enterica TaxID=28901 RepID=A9MHK3_SALAR|nr:hypothetical protein SARI_00343 [Salmonella enterica subsp. arizonae serovar 62:z4,z23:-]